MCDAPPVAALPYGPICAALSREIKILDVDEQYFRSNPERIDALIVDLLAPFIPLINRFHTADYFHEVRSQARRL